MVNAKEKNKKSACVNKSQGKNRKEIEHGQQKSHTNEVPDKDRTETDSNNEQDT